MPLHPTSTPGSSKIKSCEKSNPNIPSPQHKNNTWLISLQSTDYINWDSPDLLVTLVTHKNHNGVDLQSMKSFYGSRINIQQTVDFLKDNIKHFTSSNSKTWT